jgi:hypothetical protein
MSAPALLRQFQQADQERVDPLLCFVARVEARALLWQAGELTLHEAVDELQAAGERDGLIDRIGQDGAQAVLSHVLARVRE